MKVLVVEPQKPCRVQEINSLADMQRIVGGDIEAVYPFQEPVALVCNSDGKLLGLPMNRPLLDEDRLPYDIICGTFFVAGLGQQDFVSLTDEQIQRYKSLYRRKDNHGEADQYYVEHTHPAIISYEDFQKVQELLKRRAERQSIPHDQTPLARKIICGQCGTLYMRRISKAGYVSWVCRKHDRKAADCPNGRISEDSIHAAFLRMYRKLRTHDGIVLSPVLRQMETLSDALHRGNPAMLAVNTAIATASEQSYHLTKLHTAGLLDKAALSAKQAELNAKLTELRRERRKLLCNEDIDEQVDAIRLTIDTIRNGPETLSSFDEILFTKLVERIVVDTQSTIRFQLYGGFEFQETLEA